ncbi:stalk domain-containing protein [Paenibacillus sepulcri]|uniref:Copper amine oxidase N-terminal domain-containing protein n=1 Tax=Paenibacillus sepulcri TaxID=359917 RepID=A0ABS7CBI5_9BACL|nr:copper amine oxidase N-terminal domain-containing protein [Paenibacillus sepulcri]
MKRLTLSIVFLSFWCLTLSFPVHAGQAAAEDGIIHTLIRGDKSIGGKLIAGHMYADSLGLQNCLPFLVNSRGVSWNPDLKTVSYDSDIGDGEEHLKFQLGKNYFTDHGEKIMLASAIISMNGKIYIPIKEVAQYYGHSLKWDNRSMTLTITPNIKYDVPPETGEVQFEHFTVLREFETDLNLDGVKDEARMVTNYDENNPDYFTAPVYFEYRTNAHEPFHRIALDVPPIDLTKDNLKVRTGDLDADSRIEIGYSIDYPQMEHTERWPHILQYRDDRFVDSNLAKEYDLLLANWDITPTDTGDAQLALYEKNEVFDDHPAIHYYRLGQDGELERN